MQIHARLQVGAIGQDLHLPRPRARGHPRPGRRDRQLASAGRRADRATPLGAPAERETASASRTQSPSIVPGRRGLPDQEHAGRSRTPRARAARSSPPGSWPGSARAWRRSRVGPAGSTSSSAASATGAPSSSGRAAIVARGGSRDRGGSARGELRAHRSGQSEGEAGVARSAPRMLRSTELRAARVASGSGPRPSAPSVKSASSPRISPRRSTLISGLGGPSSTTSRRPDRIR